jgi:hypothetical protein
MRRIERESERQHNCVVCQKDTCQDCRQFIEDVRYFECWLEAWAEATSKKLRNGKTKEEK